MKSKKNRRGPRLSPSVVDADATERLKKRAQDWGLIVSAGETARSEAGNKAIARWENEGGTVLPRKKGRKR